MTELTPGLMLVHGNRAEQLREVLVAWLCHSPLDPLENECLLVHSNGIAQWLRLALAEREQGCGIAAALDFLLPSRFMWQAYRAVLGANAVPEQSPLDKDPLAWRLMRLLPALAGEPGFEPVARFLADDAGVRKRHQLAHRLADLFDQYQVYRADWLDAWSRGEAVLPDAYGRERPLPESQAWQARLWRALLDDLGAAAGEPVGRAAVHAAFMARIRASGGAPRPAGLPRRLLVFGISAMPRQILEALSGLSCWIQILVCVNNPCAHYWADILGDRDLLRARFRRQSRRPGMPEILDEDALHQQTHPLLASWGRQGRDFIGLLDDIDDPAHRTRCGLALEALHRRIDAFEELPGTTLLEQLQDDIRDLRPLAETRARWPALDAARDDSLRFHVAHSAQREVEILHDQLLAAFAADPGLQPRDVIVMVPDTEAYAPHVQAVFGQYGPGDRRHVPYALADRGQRQADPLVIVLEQLLSLPRLRLGIQEVLEWLDVPALRARFGIEAGDLPLLQAWVRDAEVRWGLHAEHRGAFGLAQAPEAAHGHTWRFGLERMLLGYAAGPDAPAWQAIEPYGETGGLQAQALGALARLLDALDRHWRLLRQDAAPARWVASLQALLDDFFLPVSDADEHTLARFREILQDWAQLCETAGVDEALPASIVAEHCLGQLDQAGLSQRFFAGAVTFATLMPMRAIPFRRVCLLGMQDGAFPRQRVPADFDLMALYPRPGDRSRREDDRYLFLEALLSARDQLYISWIGHSIHDNTPQPPSVLVSQLMDHLDRGWRCADGAGPPSRALSLHHPLQPFSRRYFPVPPDSGPGALFTYAAEWRGARRPAAAAPAPAPLPPPRRDAAVRLDVLRQFLKHPVRAFFQQRLQVYFEAPDPDLDEGEPYVRDGLAQWQLRAELLEALRRAPGPVEAEPAFRDCLERMRRRGALVAGGLGEAAARALRDSVQEAIDPYRRACGDWPQVSDETLRMASAAPDGGWTFEDTLGGWRCDAQGGWGRIVLLASHLVDGRDSYRIAPMVPAWLDHLAAHAHGRSLTTVLVSPKGCVSFDPLDPDRAAGQWRALWDAWRTGMRAALPVDIDAAGAWLRAGADPEPGGKAWRAAEETYLKRVADDLYLRRSYPDFDRLCAGGGFFHWAQVLYGEVSRAIRSYPAAAEGGA
ncbi:exodeoxyribonuclease V subunit gamma [Castellaniella defragrans]|uniref:RecBCD enzyme subunit RecC n=1 Tax=Castellaniella defragrans TaxID=75697 RepID=A0A7W9WNR6_CASDE|nr:exodeoxyribonuclease V subunit gamma [Castellaniella defragrans]MBB6083674.1 exodeoxyribonuclease V gamma subunit [Castellaniella defragrans]